MKKRTGIVGPLLLSLLVFGCGPEGEAPAGGGEGDAEEASPAKAGALVIVGGSLDSDNAGVYDAMVRGRSGTGPFCVFPTASASPRESMEGYVENFNRYLAPDSVRGIRITVDNPEAASDSSIVETIRGCSGFFFTGGSQRRIAGTFRPEGIDSPALGALRERLEAGAVISGSSAGAAMMTHPMIGGGGSVEALTHGLRGADDGEGVLLMTGLGFLDGIQVDQHFIARGRWGRLLTALLAEEADSLAFGIDEDTALEVKGREARVLGWSGVVFLDDRDATLEDGGHGGYGLIMYLLGEGDRVDLSTGQVTPMDGKMELPATGEPFPADSFPDVFARGVLDDLLSALALSTDPRVTFSQEGLMVEIRKGNDFRALHLDPAPQGKDGVLDARFLGPFVLSVWQEQAG